MRSLRAALVIGALLWTVGLLCVTLLHGRSAVRTVHIHPDAIGYTAIAAMVLGAFIVRRAVSPFDKLRRRLAGIRSGEFRRLEGRYPLEVQPLVDELNALIEHQENALARASRKAGDLAHGLKTPLAVLAQEAEAAAESGHRDLAGSIRDEVERMRRHVEYHLAHARAAASGTASGARCRVADSADGLIRTLQRLYAERGLSLQTQLPPDLTFRGQREDLDEMLGNLLDNACKWAASRVVIDGRADADRLRLIVDDDGPGLKTAMREAVLQPGVRADEAAPGSGLGLAIVRDLAGVYGGTIALDQSPLGGLRAELTLPRG